MKVQKILSLVLILLLITSVTVPTAGAAGGNVVIATADDLQNYFADPAGRTAVLSNDITAPDEAAFVLHAGRNATIDLHGKTIIGADWIETITIAGGNLTLCDSSGSGKITHATNRSEGRGIFMRSGSLLMTGGNITHNQRMHGLDDWNANGAGVYVKKGTFTMSGGTISENHALAGGGVYVEKGKFIMTGGIITGNVATHGGGVFTYYGDHFSMSGGVITQNTAKPDCGGGVYCYEGSISSPPAALSAVVTGNKLDDLSRGLYLTDNALVIAIHAVLYVIYFIIL